MDNVRDIKLLGDILRLKQIFMNLLSNAYKFTSAGGTIVVNAKEVSEQDGVVYYKFTVTDSGVGMSKDMQNRLFLPFEQESASTAKYHGGSGLGLSIVKNLVELMSGSISCESEKGVGTSFIVSIPFVVSKNTTIVEEDIIEVNQKEYNFENRKVLLVEDVEINVEIVKEFLEEVNMQVDWANNGRMAVEMFEKSAVGEYEAIFMDIQMPEMDGYEATKAIRQMDSPYKDIPIVAMTANAFEDDRQMSFRVGMNEHISKPLNEEEMFVVLWNLLSKQKEV